MDPFWIGFGLGLFTGPAIIATVFGVAALALGLWKGEK